MLLALFFSRGAETRPAHCGESAQGLSLDLALSRDRIFPGEPVQVVVTLHGNGAAIRNVGYPRLAGNRIDFVSAPEQSGDREATAYRFTGTLMLQNPGTVTIGPAKLNCEATAPAQDSGAFFGALETRTVTVESQHASLTVAPFPSGQPQSFSGAVGTFDVKITTRPDKAVVGEPLTVLTAISGKGNLEGARCPHMEGTEFQAYPVKAERTIDALSCEQVVIPGTTKPLPPVAWSYFEPQRGQFRTVSFNLPLPVPLVRVPERRASSTVTSPLPLDEKPARAWAPWAAAALLALAVTGLLAYRKKTVPGPLIEKESPAAAEVDYSNLLLEADRALHEHDVEKFYKVVSCALEELQRNPLQPASSCESSAICICRDCQRVFSDSCDRVRYGRHTPSLPEMQKTVAILRRIISAM